MYSCDSSVSSFFRKKINGGIFDFKHMHALWCIQIVYIFVTIRVVFRARQIYLYYGLITIRIVSFLFSIFAEITDKNLF